MITLSYTYIIYYLYSIILYYNNTIVISKGFGNIMHLLEIDIATLSLFIWYAI